MEPVSPLTSSLFHRGAEMQTLRVPMCSTLILYIILYCELETVCYQPLVEGRGRGGTQAGAQQVAGPGPSPLVAPVNLLPSLTEPHQPVTGWARVSMWPCGQGDQAPPDTKLVSVSRLSTLASTSTSSLSPQ